jgi:Ca2+-binding EF-hand superfamily protein
MGNIGIIDAGATKPKEKTVDPTFPGGHKSIDFDQLMSIIKESCEDREKADNYLVYAFSMFDR